MCSEWCTVWYGYDALKEASKMELSRFGVLKFHILIPLLIEKARFELCLGFIDTLSPNTVLKMHCMTLNLSARLLRVYDSFLSFS